MLAIGKASEKSPVILPLTLNSGHTMNSHLLYTRTTPPPLTTMEPVETKPCTPKRTRDGER